MRAATRVLRRSRHPSTKTPRSSIKTFDDQFDYLREILNSRVYDAAVETPLQHAAKFSSITNCDAYVKREDLQPVFSFKIRGAYNRIVNLGDVKGVVACSRATTPRASRRAVLFSTCRGDRHAARDA